MSMAMKLATSLYGSSSNKGGTRLPGTTMTYSGTAVEDSSDGTVKVLMDGDLVGREDVVGAQWVGTGADLPVTLPVEPIESSIVLTIDGDECEFRLDGRTVHFDYPVSAGAEVVIDFAHYSTSPYIELPTSPSVKAGDTVSIMVVDGKPMVGGSVGWGDSLDLKVRSIEADYVKTETLEANYAHITNGVIDNAKIGYADVEGLNAQVATIADAQIASATITQAQVQNLSTDYAHITNGTIDNASISYANVTDLSSNYAHITSGVIDNASINDANVNNLSTNYAHITNGEIDNATISYADVSNLSSNYAHITQGVIDNATIGHADVNGLSANYADIHGANIDIITAGSQWVDNLFVQTGLVANDGVLFWLDAIKVNAANIKAGTIDVERIVVTDPDTGDKHLVTWNESTSSWNSVKLDGDVIGDHTIAADKIVANSITTSHITTQNLVGTGGWINLASGTFSYVNATSGQGISWDGQNLAVAGSVTVGNSSVLLSQLAEQMEKKASYGTSSTGASTATKIVTCDAFALAAGASLTVKFSNANTSSGLLKLSVQDSSGTSLVSAADVWVAGAVTSSTNQLLWGSGAMVTFTYDGTQWQVVSEPRAWYGTCSVAAGTAAKTSSIASAVICKGAAFGVQMTYANSVANPTLNISSTGAKAIYIANARPTADSQYNWTANATVDFVFDGQYYRGGDASALAKAADAQAAATSARNTADGANAREQLVYISKASGTASVSANTTWVTDATGSQNTWTTVRPVYSSSYPVLFSATQRQTVAQSSGTTCSCTTPAKDDTTTVIDGGHITTGTIDASVATITNINASNITSGTLSANRIDTANITIGESQVTNLTTDLAGKATTAQVQDAQRDATNALKRTYVSIRVTAIDYSANSATLEATLYIDGTPTTTGVSYAWFKDGNEISSATADTYSVTSAGGGLSHAYSCKCSW